MKNITKLKIWEELQKIGFEKINYKFNGKTVTVGASLRRKLIDVSGKEFFTDIITIEPHDFKYSDGKNYHIAGDIKSPYYDKFYRYEHGIKIEFFDRVERINKHCKASEIMQTIKLMLK